MSPASTRDSRLGSWPNMGTPIALATIAAWEEGEPSSRRMALIRPRPYSRSSAGPISRATRIESSGASLRSPASPDRYRSRRLSSSSRSCKRSRIYPSLALDMRARCSERTCSTDASAVRPFFTPSRSRRSHDRSWLSKLNVSSTSKEVPPKVCTSPASSASRPARNLIKASLSLFSSATGSSDK